MKISAILLILMLSCTKASLNEIPVISAFAGELTINGNIAKTGVPVKYGDIIKTGQNSFCEITLNKLSIIKLAQNTEFVFNISESDNNLELKRGSLTGLTRKKFTKQDTYNIKTTTGIAAVRGTSYFIHIESPESSYFCVCNGTVNLKGEAEESVTALHHTARRFTKTKDGNISTDKNVAMLYHSDANIEELANKIGEKINWNKPD